MSGRHARVTIAKGKDTPLWKNILYSALALMVVSVVVAVGAGVLTVAWLVFVASIQS